MEFPALRGKFRPQNQFPTVFRSILGMLCLAASSVLAEVPKLDGIFPAGGQVGSTFTLQSVGKNPPTSKWWSDLKGLKIEPTEKENEWTCNVPNDAIPGLYRIFTYNEEGRSEVRIFAVGTAPEVHEIEPNQAPRTGQHLQDFPVNLQARLQVGNDVDTYRFTLKKDQSLYGNLYAYTLTSPVDPLVHILNSKGQRIFTAMDSRNLDPVFVFKAPEDDEYTLQVAGFAHIPQANENYTGGPSVIYRLYLHQGAIVTHYLPQIAPIDQPITVHAQGLQIPEEQSHLEITPDRVSGSGNIRLVHLPQAEFPIQAVELRGSAQSEVEPNDQQDQAQAIEFGMVGGHLSSAQDIDRYALNVKKGQTYVAQVWAQRLGLLPDTEIKVEAPDGKQLAQNLDIDGQNDPRVQWTAAEDGTHYLTIRETMRRFGPHHHYLLEIGPPVPSVQITSSASSKLNLTAGNEEKIKVSIKRFHGWNEPLTIGIDGLPEGVTCEEVAAPEGNAEVELTLKTSAECGNFQGMIDLVGKIKTSQSTDETQAPTSDTPSPAEESKADSAPESSPPPAPPPAEEPPVKRISVSLDLRGELKRGTSLVDENPGIWLTVIPQEKPAEPAPSEEEKKE